MKNLNVMAKGLLLCALVVAIGTGCSPQRKANVNEEPVANEMSPMVQEETPAGEKQATKPEEPTAKTGEEKTQETEKKTEVQ